MQATPALTITVIVPGKRVPSGSPPQASSGKDLRRVHANVPGRSQSDMTFSLRKEVIQPQVLLRLPCYDFTPIMSYTLDGYPPCGLAHRLLVQPTFVM